MPPARTATAEQARALAEDFLRTRIGRDPAALDFVEESDVTRPHRVDRTFTWKERDFDLHGATNRVEVTLLGNEAGGYREYLKVPDQWKRDYQRLRSKNEVAQTVDTAVMVVLLVGMVIVIVMRVRRHDVRWRRAALVGLIGIVLGFLRAVERISAARIRVPDHRFLRQFSLAAVFERAVSRAGAGRTAVCADGGRGAALPRNVRRQDLAGQSFHACAGFAPSVFFWARFSASR